MVSVEAELIKALRERQQKLAEDAVSFPRADYAQYLKLCGEYEGIKFALDALADIMRGNDDGEV
jgi:hypothetical protein